MLRDCCEDSYDIVVKIGIFFENHDGVCLFIGEAPSTENQHRGDSYVSS